MKALLVFLVASAAFAAGGFKPLFNGKNLDGWDGDPRLWSVQDGVIQGSTEGVKLTHNSFLITRKNYGDFVLRLRIKLRNHNTGIQFRSEALPDWVVRGLQVDAAENNYWGCIYDEKGTRGIVVNSYKEKGSTVVRLKDWNDFEISAIGDHIVVKLNGLVTADIHDTARMKGVIALQLHAGPPMQVWFKDLEIEEK